MQAERTRDQGFTVIEMMIGMAILSIILVISLTLVIAIQKNVNQQSARTNTNDQAHLALQQLDRYIRSGNVIYDPSVETSPGQMLRVYTQANGAQRCMQWRIQTEQLQVRSWSENWQLDNDVSGWRTVADGVKNTSTNPAFSLDPGTNFGGRLLNVSLAVSTNASQAGVVTVTQSIEGRNTQYGYPVNVCASVPP